MKSENITIQTIFQSRHSTRLFLVLAIGAAGTPQNGPSWREERSVT